MAHPRARPTVFGRQLLIARVEAGWPAAHVAEQLGISRATAYKWLRRHRAEGPAGLDDRSSRPRRSPRRLALAAEAEILAAGRPGDTARTASAHSRPAPLDGPPGTRPARPQPSARRRPRDDGPDPLCRLPPGCPRPPGPQEAGPDPRGRRLAGARPGRDRVITIERGRIRPPRGRRRRRQPPGGRRPRPRESAPRPPRARGRGVRVRQVRDHDRAGPDRQRLGRTRADGLSRGPWPSRCPPQADATLAPPDQRQGRALHPDADQRVGVCAAVRLERRATRRPCPASSTSTIARGPTPRSAGSHPGRRQQRPWRSQLDRPARSRPRGPVVRLLERLMRSARRPPPRSWRCRLRPPAPPGPPRAASRRLYRPREPRNARAHTRPRSPQPGSSFRDAVDDPPRHRDARPSLAPRARIRRRPRARSYPRVARSPRGSRPPGAGPSRPPASLTSSIESA